MAINVPVGVTSFVATATDESGNSAECTFSANVMQGKKACESWNVFQSAHLAIYIQ